MTEECPFTVEFLYLDTHDIHHGQTIVTYPVTDRPDKVVCKGNSPVVSESRVKKGSHFAGVRRQQLEDSTKILQRGFRRLRQRWHLVMNTVKNFNPRE